MAEYTSGSIHFTGLGNGTDFDSIIEATVEAESFRLTELEEWKADWEEKAEALQELNSTLLAYETALKNFDTESEFLVKTATSYDTDALGVTADSDADEGSHAVTVGQLAKNDVWTSGSGFANTSNASITETAATFSMTYAGQAMDVEVPAGTTLEGLVDIINNDPETRDSIRANLVYDGDEYYLQLRGLDLGADNSLLIHSNGIDGLDEGDFDHTQTAQNARLKVDGFPSGEDEWIERDSNTVDDVIDGLTLNLREADPDREITVTTSTDTSAVKENILEFVELTNEVRAAIAAINGYDADSEGYVLAGNYGVDMVEQEMKSICSSKAIGFTYYDAETGLGDIYTSLSQIGITTDAEQDSETFGQLIVDEEVLDDALADDPEAVAALFATRSTADVSSHELSFLSSVDGLTEAGDYEVSYEIVGDEIVSATINGNEAKISGNEIIGMAGNPEAGLAVRVNDLASGSHSATVSLKRGKVPEMLDKVAQLTDPESGTLVIIEDNYDEIVANAEDKIEYEENRLYNLERELIRKYSNLDSVLSELTGVQESLEYQLSQLEA